MILPLVIMPACIVVAACLRLMGPRRKLSLAISEVNKHREEDGGQRSVEKTEDRDVGESSRTVRQSSRPQLVKQASTELTAAYRQVCGVG